MRNTKHSFLMQLTVPTVHDERNIHQKSFAPLKGLECSNSSRFFRVRHVREQRHVPLSVGFGICFA